MSLPESQQGRSAAACTCAVEIHDGIPKRITTVACPVHHLMPDGTPAGEVEIRCMCGNFADERECRVYRNTEEGCDCGCADDFVCRPCWDWADLQGHLKLIREEQKP